MKLFHKKIDDSCFNHEVIKKEGKIKILGMGCPKCEKVVEAVQQALLEMSIHMEVEHVEDIIEIAKYGVMSTPALVINEEVVSFGKVLSVDDVKYILERKL